MYIILVVPIIFDFTMVVQMSPYKSVRYVMNILPIIALIFLILVDDLFKNHKKSCAIILTIFSVVFSTYGILTNPVKYLYKGYDKYLQIADKYKDNRFVLICSSKFTHLQDLPEFIKYKESMIVDTYNIEYLSNFKEFEEDDEIILGIKNWLDESPEKLMKKVMEATGYTNYEFLHDAVNSSRETVYRLYR